MSSIWCLNVDVCDSLVAVASLWVLWQRRVGSVRFWEFGDYVPCVEETGNKSETAQEDIDERISGADASFDPDCKRGKENGNQAQEDVGGAHSDYLSCLCSGF